MTGSAGNRPPRFWGGSTPALPENPRGLAFEYVGHAPLTVVGPASGQRYRFAPGSILAVDPRDRTALASIPLLRRR
jgi:hypothetical protein